MSSRIVPFVCVLSGLLASAPLSATTDAELAATVAKRLHGDRTGACMAVAVIESGQVAHTYACANDADRGRIGPDSAFEIGSVTKTMTAALLARMIVDGKASLDDPLGDWLPEGTHVPEFEGKPILLRHLVTHTSGLPVLPSRLRAASMDDPYAKLDQAELLASLEDVKLSAAPGTHFAYSNFAMMVLSGAIARRAGSDYETLVKRELFAPLGMNRAYINLLPPGVKPAQGHTPNGQAAPAWHLQTDLAGVGGVRATLEDMVRYVQAQLGQAPKPLLPALQLSQRQVSDAPPMAMNWMIAKFGERRVLTHEGATGGFSALAAFEPARKRGVVILSDTGWTSVGGLEPLGMALLGTGTQAGAPRRETAADPETLQALTGDYDMGGLRVRLLARDGQLVVQPAGQPELVMGHDDAGDYYPRTLDALLTPEPTASGMSFSWMQGGGRVMATRLDAASAPAVPALSAAQLAEYAGTYPLVPGFELKVAAIGDALTVQGTGQPAIVVEAVGKDRFSAAAVGAQFEFERDVRGKVIALVLRQNGQVLHGDRQ